MTTLAAALTLFCILPLAVLLFVLVLDTLNDRAISKEQKRDSEKRKQDFIEYSKRLKEEYDNKN